MVSAVAGKRLFMVSVVDYFMVPVVAGNISYGFRRWFFNGFRLLQDRGCVSDGNRKKATRTFP